MKRTVAVGLLVVLASALSACGGGGESSGTPSTPTTPTTPTTYTLSGRVTEAGRATPIVGATVAVADGPNTGRSATTDSSGTYSIPTLQPGGFTANASATGYVTRGIGVDLTANKTVDVELALAGPRKTFGAGQYRVGTEVAAGRYYTNPDYGCYWERQSGFGGTLEDIIANDFVGYNAAQYIVDILPSDRGFEADEECGTWYSSARYGHQATITPGIWRVGTQITPGTYRASVRSGCYWERLRNFQGVLASIISNDFVASGGTRYVTIRPGDVGFQSDGDCGTWTRTSSVTGSGAREATQTRFDVEYNRMMNRSRYGRLSGMR